MYHVAVFVLILVSCFNLKSYSGTANTLSMISPAKLHSGTQILLSWQPRHSRHYIFCPFVLDKWISGVSICRTLDQPLASCVCWLTHDSNFLLPWLAHCNAQAPSSPLSLTPNLYYYWKDHPACWTVMELVKCENQQTNCVLTSVSG